MRRPYRSSGVMIFESYPASTLPTAGIWSIIAAGAVVSAIVRWFSDPLRYKCCDTARCRRRPPALQGGLCTRHTARCNTVRASTRCPPSAWTALPLGCLCSRDRFWFCLRTCCCSTSRAASQSHLERAWVLDRDCVHQLSKARQSPHARFWHADN